MKTILTIILILSASGCNGIYKEVQYTDSVEEYTEQNAGISCKAVQLEKGKWGETVYKNGKYAIRRYYDCSNNIRLIEDNKL